MHPFADTTPIAKYSSHSKTLRRACNKFLEPNNPAKNGRK